MKKILFIALTAILNLTFADEGMWQPVHLPSIAKELQKAGLQLIPEDLSDLTGFPMGAIVSLGGCTASFVSDKGLVVTNHHCAYGSLQYNSTKDNNLIEKGFLAKSFSEELQTTAGSRVYVTENIVNVTKQITSGISDRMTGTDRYLHIDKMSKQLVAECEVDKAYRCSVVNFHGGLEYNLFKQLMIRDVRLVHAPAGSVGKYGGNIDNWMWPRHTGDYAFLRAYVNQDGKPADYSEDNVPYQPTHHLKVSAKGVDDGDYIMVLGYPGRTSRYRTATEVKNTFTENYPLIKELLGSVIADIKQNSDKGSDARIRYQSLIAGLANSEKNRGSMINSYLKGTTQQRKSALDRDLRDWVNMKSSRKKSYGHAINELDNLIEKSHQDYHLNTILRYVSISSMLSSATRLYRLALEKQKSDMDRESGYQDRDMNRFTQSMKRISKRYTPKVDSAILMDIFSRYGHLPENKRIPDIDRFLNIDDGFDESRLQNKLNSMYEKTQLGEEAVRLEWMNKTVADFEKSDDPFIQYAVSTYQARKKREDEAKNLSGELNAVRPKYMKAIIAYNHSKDLPVYADANSTLRVTFGNVKGYTPKDGIYATPFTRLEGLQEKETGKDPFNSPEKVLQLLKKKSYGSYYYKAIDSVPVNFLGSLDITGGNSGSPTLNDKAELVGLAFDGVYESIIGDWDYDPDLNRTIAVDSRYMLWLMDLVYNADNLIKEMDIITK